jgi:hypothetical protein
MAINLTHRADYHKWLGTKPTTAPSVNTVEVSRTVDLPCSVTLTVKATAEILADGAVGRLSGVEWTFSERPFVTEDLEPGAFYDAFAAAVEGAMDEALNAAHSLASTDISTVTPGLAGGPSAPNPLPT